jgi:hypothetical protein
VSFTGKLDALGYVAHYRLGEASGAIVDRSGTANNGTVNNDNCILCGIDSGKSPCTTVGWEHPFCSAQN